MKISRIQGIHMIALRTPHRAGLVAALLALVGAAPQAVAAQSLEGSKWSIDQEGVDTPVIWWLGSQGRVRTGDIGTILPGYQWVQREDSLIVSVGDTVRYSGVLMANRLVGVRTGPRRQEGWWSGARADAPTTVAQAPATQITPPATNPNTEQMNRPVEPAVTAPPPTSPAPATGQPRTIRRIERADGGAQPSVPAAGGGREIRRLPRPGARNAAGAADLPATVAIPTERFAGRWVRSDTGGMVERFEAKADGSFILSLSTGGKGTGTWANTPNGTQATLASNEGGSAVIRFWEEGGELSAVIVTAVGARRTWHFRRVGGPSNP